MDIITILAVTPIIIGVLIIYLILCWLIPLSVHHTFKEALPNIIGVHLGVLFLAWLIWGAVYMIEKTNTKTENNSIVTNVEKS